MVSLLCHNYADIQPIAAFFEENQFSKDSLYNRSVVIDKMTCPYTLRHFVNIVHTLFNYYFSLESNQSCITLLGGGMLILEI